MIASSPVAAWMSSAGMFSARLSMMRDGEAPGHERREEREPRAGRDGPLIAAPRADHVGGDAGEHEDALEPFAEHQDRDVEDARAEIAVRGRIGESAGAEDLQHEDRGHGGGGQGRARTETERTREGPFDGIQAAAASRR